MTVTEMRLLAEVDKILASEMQQKPKTTITGDQHPNITHNPRLAQTGQLRGLPQTGPLNLGA